MRMRQSLAQFEAAFRQEAAASVVTREKLRKQAVHRSRARRHERVQRQGKLRFIGLATAIIVTALLVTLAMFEALALLVG
jgi:anti-sigma-K factor RskA